MYGLDLWVLCMGPPSIFWYPWLHSLVGLSVLRSWPWRGDEQYQNGLPRPPDGGWGGKVPAHKVGLQCWLWERICRLWPVWSSRIPATGGKFDPSIGSGSLDEVEIACLTWGRRHIFRGTSGRDFECALIILSRLNQWWTCTLPLKWITLIS